jgi:tellurite resistance protein
MSEFPDEDLAKTMKKIADLAKEDGKITPEEYNILKRLSFDVAEYLITLETSKEDGVIDDEEKAELLRLKEKIVHNAKNIAASDGIIDNDEEQLIKKIVDLLDK